MLEDNNTLMKDSRFVDLFNDPAFSINENSEEYKQMFPSGRKKRIEKEDDSEEEEEEEKEEEESKISTKKMPTEKQVKQITKQPERKKKKNITKLIEVNPSDMMEEEEEEENKSEKQPLALRLKSKQKQEENDNDVIVNSGHLPSISFIPKHQPKDEKKKKKQKF